ncbi:uncharacterized protein EI90DRAFT_3059652 [Cantharellus anzutake]|uniref:uncharacterized protein n=1 Tax=Cantharellus anzutake TaxID=1750568 RepID=UPI0019035C7B|nr:uncharacterized protein EI90DRAFT_3059652 [Cantharellus anzutake]KAF8330885.1 hypothetical protein EI90DRAFT_3059652 [Cantharellus anzutake]
MTLISVSDDPHVQLLASPDPSTPSFHPSSWLAVPHRRTLGFSPVARYIGAFDGVSAFTWSTESGEFIACYRVTNFSSWIMNPTVPTTRSYLIPDPVSTRLTPLAEGDTADVHLSGADAAHDSDGHWIKHPFLDLSPSMHEGLDVYSSVTGRTPLLWTGNISEELPIWFDGRTEFTVPRQYPPVDFRASGINHLGAWYGDRVPSDATNLYRLRSSKDGTRFLLQGQTAVPIVVDISQVV